jgi:hypothetical protein
MAGELSPAAVPAAVAGFSFRFETGALPEIKEHAIGLEAEQILSVEVLRVLEWSASKAHRRKRKRMSELWNEGSDWGSIRGN